MHRKTTAIDCGFDIVFFIATDISDYLDNLLLVWMIDIPVCGDIEMLLDTPSEHPGMFSRTVAIDRCQAFSFAQELFITCFIFWHMGFTPSIVLCKIDFLQHIENLLTMKRLTAMACAKQGQLLFCQIKRLHCPRYNNRQCLKWFHR